MDTNVKTLCTETRNCIRFSHLSCKGVKLLCHLDDCLVPSGRTLAGQWLEVQLFQAGEDLITVEDVLADHKLEESSDGMEPKQAIVGRLHVQIPILINIT
jgi:hypothetical protein